jgi:ribosomal protein S18 acetylase RimI-like enzyme
MKIETSFNIGLQGYSIYRLFHEDIQIIQEVFEKCNDYLLLVEGKTVERNTGEEEFLSVPKGKSLEEKLVFGIFNQQKEIIGYLDTLCIYPEEKCCWIALLLFVPEYRAKSMGQKVVQGFIEYMSTRGVQEIRLGVIEENYQAKRFWNNLGFELIHTTESRPFGNKAHKVHIMRRILIHKDKLSY